MANLASLVAAEYAFASLSARLGTRDAFLTHLADNSILFRPRPVPGKAWSMSQPLHPGRLTWYPGYAALAAAGDLGCTTGPWEFRPNSLDDRPIAHGYFMSLWRVQANGRWKVELDCGISCPPPLTPVEPLRPNLTNEPGIGETPPHDLDQVCRQLLDMERALISEAAHDEVGAVFARYITDETRVYRTDVGPYLGCEAIRSGLHAHPGADTWQPVAVRASCSGDLGYVYGFAQCASSRHCDPIESCYLRVWKQIDGLWRIFIDVNCPISDA